MYTAFEFIVFIVTCTSLSMQIITCTCICLVDTLVIDQRSSFLTMTHVQMYNCIVCLQVHSKCLLLFQLAHPVLQSLKGTEHGWLIDLLFAFNSGM